MNSSSLISSSPKKLPRNFAHLIRKGVWHPYSLHDIERIATLVDIITVMCTTIERVSGLQPASHLFTLSDISLKVCLVTRPFIVGNLRYLPESWVIRISTSALTLSFICSSVFLEKIPLTCAD